MEIVELDLSDTTRVDELFALYRAVHAAEWPDKPPPLREPFLLQLRQDDPEVRFTALGARAAGKLVGGGLLILPKVDNRHLAMVDVWVDPVHRRQGAGRAMVDWATRCARDGRRTTLLAQATRPVPDGPPRGDAGAQFLTALGFAPALENRRRRVDLRAVDPAAEQRLHDECRPHATGYECVTWDGPMPEELADGAAHLVNRLVADAPRGEVDIQETTVDTQRLRADERNALDRGTRLVGAAAVHHGTGEVAAVTRIDVRPAGDHGQVWLTVAHPGHRGHRLGTIVKIMAHRRVRQTFPQLRYVATGNADANAHMVAINDRLGYVAYEAATNYQLTL